jgi:hypothetical protein
MPARVPQTLWTDYTLLLEQGRHDRERAWSDYRETASRDRRGLKEKYRQQRRILAALPVSALDKKRLTKQLALRQGIDVRNLRRRLAAQRKAIQKTPHPGTWRHFVASRVADRDARAIRLLQRRERDRGRCNEVREVCDAGRRSGAADRRSKRGRERTASRHNNLVPRNWALNMSPMG